MQKEIIEEQGRSGKAAAGLLANASIQQRNGALTAMAKALRTHAGVILAENARDMETGRSAGLTKSMLDRLLLTEDRVENMAKGLEALVRLEDPLGQTSRMWKRPNGMEIAKVSVPLGLVAMIYEARPNVTVEAAGLCIKTGNSVLLKGSSTAYYSNRKLVEVLNMGAGNLPSGSIQIIDSKEREAVDVLMKMNETVDVIIPRGGAGLIANVVQHAMVPVIETGVGNCHAYVDDEADFEMAINIIMNGKTQRPSVCNALEKVLIHKKIADSFIPRMEEALKEKGVEIHACKASIGWFKEALPIIEEELYTEYLDYILGVVLVDDVEAACAHINRYGSHHSEVIITDSYQSGKTFQRLVDSACVYHNVSTRFSDGEEFGFGAEIGISTQKIHARGPMGLDALTSSKYVISGEGQIR